MSRLAELYQDLESGAITDDQLAELVQLLDDSADARWELVRQAHLSSILAAQPPPGGSDAGHDNDSGPNYPNSRLAWYGFMLSTIVAIGLVVAFLFIRPAEVSTEWAFNFAPQNIREGLKAPGMIHDIHHPYDPQKGYGWIGQLPKVYRIASNKDVPLAWQSKVFAGSRNQPATFAVLVPPGSYVVSVVVGGVRQGPHQIVAEGVTLIDAVRTTADQRYHQAGAQVTVVDGRLDILIGRDHHPPETINNDLDTGLLTLSVRRVSTNPTGDIQAP